MIISALFCRRSLDKHAKGRVTPLQNITVILTKFPFVRLQRFKHMILFGNINKGIEEYKSAPGALLVDVREADEFQRGHIPGAVNEPLSGIAHTALPKASAITEERSKGRALPLLLQFFRMEDIIRNWLEAAN